MTMADDMWALIPAVYRRRDADNGNVLRALVAVLGEQAQVIHDDISRTYDNWFIETCDDWVAPYIGELVGARPYSARGEGASAQERAALAEVAPGRMLVANTIRWRRRRGSAALLGQIVWDVARWPAGVVEFGIRLAVAQDLRFPTRGGGTVGLRNPRPLLDIGGPGDPVSRSVDVRDAGAHRAPGRFGAANVGVFVFRRKVVSVAMADAGAVDDEGSGQFTFDPLGRDVELHRPTSITVDLPGPITRDALARRRPKTDREGSGWIVDPDLYGEDAALMVWTQHREGEPFEPVSPDRIAPANLSRWRERPTGDRVAIDPELGRIAFSDKGAPDRVRVSYAYAVTGPRGAVAAKPAPVAKPFDTVHIVDGTRETGHRSLRAALERWRSDGSGSSLIEIRDDATYDEDRLLIDMSKGDRTLVIRAAEGRRPIIRLNEDQADALDAWRVRGGRGDAPGGGGASLTLEGLTIGGRGILVEGYAGALTVRQCTLIPGWTHAAAGERRDHDASSLAFHNCAGPVSIERSIVGPIHVRADEQILAPLPLSISDSILDAGDSHPVFHGPDPSPYVELQLRRSTVLGHLTCHGIALAENSIFSGRVDVMRRQRGLVRFCYAPAGSRLPRRFACLPKSGVEEAVDLVFVSRTYGDPGYAELAPECASEIRHGADDQEALGAYHDLYWTARDASLREALADYLPAGVSAGVIHVD